MAVPVRVANAYQQVQPAVVALEAYVSATVRTWCDQRDYLYRARRKDVASLSEKLETGRFERWSELDDLFACTVVVPTPSHEEHVISFLDAAFERVQLRRRNSTKKSPEVFRFDSTRYIGKVGEQIGLNLTPGVSSILFEVQIPTIFEHAWSVVTHDLVYKSADIDWRKARLAAQLKAAVEQIEVLIAGFERNVDLVPVSPYPETDAKASIVQGFKQLIADGIISSQLEPRSWSRFADNVYSLVRSYARNNYAVPKLAGDLVTAISELLRSDDRGAGVVGGSLFQAVEGLVNAGITDSSTLDNFIVVESVELRDLHGVAEVAKPFDFDG